MSNLVVQIYQHELPVSIVEWCNEAAQEMLEPSFFCSGDWLASAALFERDIEILTVSERESGDLIAVLPLTRARNMLGGVEAKVVGRRFHPDPTGLICKKESLIEASSAIRKFFESELRWDSLTIDWTTEKECTAWGVEGKPQTVAPYLPIGKGFDDILAGFRKKKRYNLKNSVKQLLEARGATVVESRTPEEKLALFREFFELHRLRAQERSLDSSIEGDDFFNHHSNLLRQSEHAKIFALRLKGKTIAVVYGFAFANRFFYYQVAHDPKYGDLSPGKVILYEVIKHYCESGFTEFNFLQGDEDYKGLWTSEKRSLFRMRLERDNRRMAALRGLEGVKSHIKGIRGRLRDGH